MLVQSPEIHIFKVKLQGSKVKRIRPYHGCHSHFSLHFQSIPLVVYGVTKVSIKSLNVNSYFPTENRKASMDCLEGQHKIAGNFKS